MLDTLRLANRLNAAGMDRAQAETLADELNAQLREGIATRADLRATAWQILAAVGAMFVAHFVGVWWLIAGLGERAVALEALGRTAAGGG